MTKLTNTQRLAVLADALKQAQEDIKKLERELKVVNKKLSKYENKTIGGFMVYHSPTDLGYNEDTENKQGENLIKQNEI